MPYTGPAYQNMISHNEPETVESQHRANLRVIGATEADCWLERMEPTRSWERRDGFKCRYQIHWTTYLGWRTYMLGTGCFASDLQYEREHPDWDSARQNQS